METQPVSVPESFETNSDLIEVGNPLFAVFGFFRYYLLQQKYKAIVKAKLDHPRYYEMRDQIVEQVEESELGKYWTGCLLSLVQA